ncbi:MAG: hypothetical protein AB7U63_11425 [Porticoccaceae bacterium]
MNTKTVWDPEGYVPATDNEKWNQSYFYGCYDPETRIGCMIRVGILENQKETNGFVIFFRDGQPLFTRINMNLPYFKERLADGFEIAGVHFSAPEPLQSSRIQFSSKDFSFDLTWEGIYNPPMIDCVEMSKDQDGTFAKEMMNVHLEGPYRITGSVTIREEGDVNINGTGYRDLSYGPRNWDIMHTYRLAWPYFPAKNITFATVHGQSVHGQSAYLKMMHDGNEWLGVKSMTPKNDYYEDNMGIKAMHWKVVDEKDREWQFTAKNIFRWFIPLDTFCMTEQIMEYQLIGENGETTVGYGLGECGYRFPFKGNGG